MYEESLEKILWASVSDVALGTVPTYHCETEELCREGLVTVHPCGSAFKGNILKARPLVFIARFSPVLAVRCLRLVVYMSLLLDRELCLILYAQLLAPSLAHSRCLVNV